MWCECTDVTQRHNTDFLRCNTARISLLRPFLESASPFNPFAAGGGKMAARAISSALYLSKTTFSPSPAEHSPPPSILLDTFVQSGMASSLPHMGGETIGVNQSTSPIRQPTVRRAHFGKAGAYQDGERTIRRDLAPGLSGPGQDFPGR